MSSTIRDLDQLAADMDAIYDEIMDASDKAVAGLEERQIAIGRYKRALIDREKLVIWFQQNKKEADEKVEIARAIMEEEMAKFMASSCQSVENLGGILAKTALDADKWHESAETTTANQSWEKIFSKRLGPMPYTKAGDTSVPGFYENDDDIVETSRDDWRAATTLQTAIVNVVKDCKCTASGLAVEVLLRLGMKTSFQAAAGTEDAQVHLLGSFVAVDPSLKNFCNPHPRKLAGWLDLRNNAITHEVLATRMLLFWEERGNISELKVKEETASWWHLTDRTILADDHLGIYKSRARPYRPRFELSQDRARIIIEAILPGAYEQFQENGSIVFSKLFGYLWEGVEVDGHSESGIGDLIQEEFDMYLHPQRERNGNSNKGWLRTMIHSLTQQLIRQDLGYWMIYSALRDAHNYRLVSYPYYAKRLSKVQERGQGVNGYVTGLKSLTFTKEDEEEFGNFVPIPCLRGDARITKPDIPHGSTGPQQKDRKTVLPWFVAVQPDMERLDNEEAESWNELEHHHANLTAPKLTPSGHPNKYGRPPHRFPGSERLILHSPVSNALVCITKWSEKTVQKEAELLLGEDRTLAWHMVLRSRLDALQQFKRRWESIKELEREAYEEESFF